MPTTPKLTLSVLITILFAAPAGAQQLLAPSGHAAALLPDRTIVVMGGDGGSNGIPTTKAIYFPSGSDIAVQAGSLVLPRTHHTAMSMYDGRILVVGGNDGYGGMESLEVFDPATYSFTLSKARLAYPRQDARAYGLSDGRVLIRGGLDRDAQVTVDEVYDPRSDTMAFAPPDVKVANVSTDRLEYAPGDTVYVSGSGFSAGEHVDLMFDENPLVRAPETFSTIAAADGSITNCATYHVDRTDLGTAFTLSAVGTSSGLTASSTFHDAATLVVQNGALWSPTSVDAPGSFTVTFRVRANGGASQGTQFQQFTGVNVAVVLSTGENLPAGYSQVSSERDVTIADGTSHDFSINVKVPANASSASLSVMVRATAATGVPVPPFACGDSAVCTADSRTQQVSIVGSVKQVTPTVTASGKTYDGTTTASASCSLAGVNPGDEVSCNVTSASFGDANVGAGKTVTASLSLSGANASHYQLSSTTVTTRASITTAAVTVTADAKIKTYGDADPPLTYRITSGTLVNGDAFSGSLTRVAGEAVGSYGIQQGSLVLSTNYTLTYVGANLTIDERPVTVTADPKSKTYGGADPTLTYRITSGTLVNGDTFSGSLTRVAGETVGAYAIQQGSLALSTNYRLTYVGANLTITPRAIAVTADTKTKVLGAPDPPLTYQITSGSLVAGDSFSGNLTRVAGEDIGVYPIQQGTLALDANYTLSYVGASLTITYAPAGTGCLGEPGHAVLQPVTDRSIFKLGRTVPVKFRVCDANGHSVGPLNGLSPSKGMYNLATYSATGTGANVLLTASTTRDSDFRWDPSAQQWIFNLDTGRLSASATYAFRIVLKDRSWIDFEFGVK